MQKVKAPKEDIHAELPTPMDLKGAAKAALKGTVGAVRAGISLTKPAIEILTGRRRAIRKSVEALEQLGKNEPANSDQIELLGEGVARGIIRGQKAEAAIVGLAKGIKYRPNSMESTKSLVEIAAHCRDETLAGMAESAIALEMDHQIGIGRYHKDHLSSMSAGIMHKAWDGDAAQVKTVMGLVEPRIDGLAAGDSYSDKLAAVCIVHGSDAVDKDQAMDVVTDSLSDGFSFGYEQALKSVGYVLRKGSPDARDKASFFLNLETGSPERTIDGTKGLKAGKALRECARLHKVDRVPEAKTIISNSLRGWGLKLEDLEAVWEANIGLEGLSMKKTRGKWAQGFGLNLEVMAETEEHSPGAIKHLNKKYGMKVFGRYTPKTLIHIHDGDRQGRKPADSGFIALPLDDHNGAFYQHREEMEKLVTGLDGRIWECEGRVSVAKAVQKQSKEFGKIDWMFLGGHGTPKQIAFGDTPLTGDEKRVGVLHFQDLEGEGVKRLRDDFADKVNAVLSSCSTGRARSRWYSFRYLPGFAENLATFLGKGSTVHAPNRSTSLKSLEFEREPDGELKFSVEYAKPRQAEKYEG